MAMVFGIAGVISLLTPHMVYANSNGWVKKNSSWYYVENDTSVQGWKWIDGNWYFFDTDGKMYTSWLEYKNRWYFLSTAMDGENGKMLTGWNWIDGYSYYFDQEGDVGAMAAATTTKDGYRVDQNGRWVHENSTPVFQRNQGLQSKPFVSLSSNSEKKQNNKRNTVSKRSGGGGGGSSLDSSSRRISGASQSNVKDDATSTKGVKEETEQNGARRNGSGINITSSEDTKGAEHPSVSHESPIPPSDVQESEALTNPQSSGESEAPSNPKSGGGSATPSNPQNNGESEAPSNPKEGGNSGGFEGDENPIDNEMEEDADEIRSRKAAILKDYFTSVMNDNVKQYITEDGEIRTILWTKGIDAPNFGTQDSDFQKVEFVQGKVKYVDFIMPLQENAGWYDTNKAIGNDERDRNLCFGAVSANMLLWWRDQNREYIDRFIEKKERENAFLESRRNTLNDIRFLFHDVEILDSVKGITKSNIFDYFKLYFGRNTSGFYSGLLIDMFLNGYTPNPNGGTNYPERFTLDRRGGFFNEVFKTNLLTDRIGVFSYSQFSYMMKQELSKARAVGLIHSTGSSTSSHIINVWGAEYDENKKIVAIFVTDSDDTDEENKAMKRYEVRNVNGKSKISTNVSNLSSGSETYYLETLDLGVEHWDRYERN